MRQAAVAEDWGSLALLIESETSSTEDSGRTAQDKNSEPELKHDAGACCISNLA